MEQTNDDDFLESNFFFKIKFPFMRITPSIISENKYILEKQKYRVGNKMIHLGEFNKKMQESTTVFGGEEEDSWEKMRKELEQFLDNEENPLHFETEFKVKNIDCIALCMEIQKLNGETPLLLNLAERRINHVNGAWYNPFFGSQEEAIERRSSYRNGLDPLLNPTFYQILYETNEGKLPTYHIPAFGVVYHRGIPVFRNIDYSFLNEPFFIDVIASGAVDLRQSFFHVNESSMYIKNGELDVVKLMNHTKIKIRFILGAAIRLKYKYLILGAMGCGAFKNPPEIVAQAFSECFKEPLFEGKFKCVTFAILERGENLGTIFKNKLGIS